MNELVPEEVSATAGILLSLGFSYLPGIKERFAALDPTHKRLVMLALLAAVTVGVFALGCVRPRWLVTTICSEEGAWSLLRIFAAAVIANQATFEVSPHSGETDEGHGYGQ